MLLRHGQPDYAIIADYAPRYAGHRYDLVHMAQEGEAQILAAVPAALAFRAELIVSSPYPRCLHAAAILGRALDLDLHVHANLHEWLPVLDGSAPVSAEIVAAAESGYWRAAGAPCEPSGPHAWESDDDIRRRVGPVLDEYRRKHRRVLVVTHEVVIRALTGERHTAFGASRHLSW